MREGWVNLSANQMRALVEMMKQNGEIERITVVGKSMEPTIMKGDQLEVDFDIKEINIGDIIVFVNQNHLTTHRVTDHVYKAGVKHYATRGDSPLAGSELVEERDIICKVVGICKTKSGFL